MELKELGRHLYEENHSPFYIKYYTLSDGFLEQLMRTCSLISGTLSISFSDKYVFFKKSQGREIVRNAGLFSDTKTLRELISSHLRKMERLKEFCRAGPGSNEKEKPLRTFLKYLNLYRGIPTYDFLIHLIWSERAREFVRDNRLSYLEFFEITCPPKTIVTESYFRILDLIKNRKKDIVRREYGWLYNLESYLGMTPSKAETKKKRLERELESRKREHSVKMGRITDKHKREWVLLFNELQKWVNWVDFNEREIDYYSAELFRNICSTLDINLETLELIKNLLPEDIAGFKDGSLSADSLRDTIRKRMKGYLISYSKKKTSLGEGH